MAEERVFVYGTLKRGEANHHWLAGARPLGEAGLDGVVLHDLGPFPMAVEGPGRCFGEVYALEEAALAQLDRLEGTPRLYRREMRQLLDGSWAWVYLGQPRQVRHAPLLAEGHWQGEGLRRRKGEQLQT